ncbi:MAG: rhodanese-like domain-containing protein [Cyclobacteriaceae bacterium]|nr:rhodanese-like domain-containing protein [Cyclobacteriaceae bacterium]
MESKKFAEADKSKAVILDVRTPAEYNSGHVQGARSMDIYSKNFTEEINKLDKDQTYYVYCKTGIRSRNAAGYMRQAGFKNVCEIQGGILSLARTGVTLVK